MKLKIKNATTSLMLITALSFGTVLHAEEVALPVVSKPAILSEGTQRELTAAQIAELLPWAKESRALLIDLLESVQSLTNIDKHERMVEIITSVVGESAGKNSELLMRYVLNRGIVIDDVLNREMNQDAVGSIDAKNRVLVASIKMAIKYYDQDMQMIANKTKTSYASFGINYFEFLNELNKSIFDASAQYHIQKTALEWLQWDLYRDLNNTTYASQILKINNSLKLLGAKKLTDAQSIANIRHMKQVVVSLNVEGKAIKTDEVAQDTFVNKSVAPVPTPAPSVKKKVVFSYNDPSFLACVSLKSADLNSSEASEQCMKIIKESGFDFKSENFQACFKVYYKDLSSNQSVNICISEIQNFNFNFQSSSFDRCHVLKSLQLSSNTAARECREEIHTSSFDYSTRLFRSCYSYVYQSKHADTSVNICTVLIKKHKNKVDFSGSNFKRCFDLKKADHSAADAVEYCTGEISSSSFNFESSEFSSCYGIKYKTLTASASVNKCVQEMK